MGELRSGDGRLWHNVGGQEVEVAVTRDGRVLQGIVGADSIEVDIDREAGRVVVNFGGLHCSTTVDEWAKAVRASLPLVPEAAQANVDQVIAAQRARFQAEREAMREEHERQAAVLEAELQAKRAELQALGQ
ncbi:MAG TPA: hypothetical protein VNM91_11840, partial [Dehalococcoidia bacterium]|nr:hypothetical protein [Dehalococcoidia bacterium]